MNIRRKLALLICPELSTVREDKQTAQGVSLRASGVKIVKMAAEYEQARGEKVSFHSLQKATHPDLVSDHDLSRLVKAIERLRAGNQASCHWVTVRLANRVFQSAEQRLALCADIPRPPKKKDAA